MPPHERIQSAIHFLESATLTWIMKVLMLFMVIMGLVLIYDWVGYRNFNSQEAMDSAQLARNVAEGRGYTTYFIRPFSIYLLQHKQLAGIDNATNISANALRLEGNHPDLANPPVYPLFLAGLMKTFKFNYEVTTTKSFWSAGGYFQRYQPEFVIALANQFLLVGAAFLTFFIGRKLFDLTVAWVSALLLLGCNLLWEFSVSGLSTILLLDFFLLLVICLVKFEETGSAPEPSPKKLLLWTGLLGLIIGAGTLTRYSFGWLGVPLIAYFALYGGVRRVRYVFTLLVAAGVVVAPWILRNLHVSGTCLGVTGYAVVDGTTLFPGTTLENSTAPFLSGMYHLGPYLDKLKTDLHLIFENELTSFSGSWVLMLFFTGLLLGFRSQTAKRLRYFVMGSLGTLVVAEALGRTHLSSDVPTLNSENLLVLLAPLTFIYGTVFFLILVDQMKLIIPQLRYVILAGLVLLSSVPFLCQIAPPRTRSLAYPPYHPPEIQSFSRGISADKFIMSDVPWAVAWYGQRECVALTLDMKNDFFAINDDIRPIDAVYLTPKTLDGKYLSDMERGAPDSWERLALLVGENRIPAEFPLRHPKGLASGLLLLEQPAPQ